MRINVIRTQSRDIDALFERVTMRAKAYEISPEEALREALRGWLEKTEGKPVPEHPEDRILEATREPAARAI